jgi:hypothetical protein
VKWENAKRDRLLQSNRPVRIERSTNYDDIQIAKSRAIGALKGYLGIAKDAVNKGTDKEFKMILEIQSALDILFGKYEGQSYIALKKYSKNKG